MHHHLACLVLWASMIHKFQAAPAKVSCSNYQYVPRSVTWAEAALVAANMTSATTGWHGHLVTISSAEENACVQEW